MVALLSEALLLSLEQFPTLQLFRKWIDDQLHTRWLNTAMYSQLFKKEFLQSKVQQDLAQNKRRAWYLSWR